MTLNFLLIEDNPDHAELIQRALARDDREMTMHHTLDGEQGIQYLRESNATPDAILLDLKLPGLSGHEVLMQLKSDERLCVIPVIVLTTSTNSDDRMRAYHRHANSYLVKPVRMSEFRQLLDDVWVYWTQRNVGIHLH